MYDQDKAGKHNMYKIRSNYPELDYFVIPRYLKAKDFSDLHDVYSNEQIDEFVRETVIYCELKFK